MGLAQKTSSLDLSVIMQIRQIAQTSDPDLFTKLVDIYNNDCIKYITVIEQGLTEPSLEKAKSAAHAMKSASHNMGAIYVAELCQQLELHPATSHNEEVAKLIHEIMDNYYTACASLDEIRTDLTKLNKHE